MARLQHIPQRLDTFDMTTFALGALSAMAIGAALRIVSQPKTVKAPTVKADAQYPADFYPGGRTLETPYGAIRMYEFGPEDGKRILLIHGITTPCAVFSGVLPRLVEAGHRVCTFDLFGRGYSDAPNLPHDERLYNAQVLCVIQSLGWNKFNLLGYSLGGALAASFASYFPASIEKLILVAPAGLLRRADLPLARKIAISEHTPFLLISRTLNKVLSPKVKEVAENAEDDRVDIVHVLQWQLDNHRGFKESYLSCFRHAPIFDQWQMFERLKSHDLPTYAIWGDGDDVVDTKIVSENLVKALPDVKLSIIDDVGHDVCTARPAELTRKLVLILDS